jgi:hypothetical protein
MMMHGPASVTLYLFDSFSEEQHATTFTCCYNAYYRPNDSVDTRTRVM